MILQCHECLCADSNQFRMSDDGRSFTCHLCGAVTFIPSEYWPKEPGAVTSELLTIILNAQSLIEIGKYSQLKNQLINKAESHSYSPDLWYYLACAETEGFSKENEEASKHLEYAQSRFENSAFKRYIINRNIGDLISTAQSRLERLAEIRPLRVEEEKLQQQFDLMYEDTAALAQQINNKQSEIERAKQSTDNISVNVNRTTRKLFWNRICRLIQAVIAVGLFALMPWSRDLWNQLLPFDYRIWFLPEIPERIWDAMAQIIPRYILISDVTLILGGVIITIISLILLFKALISKKAGSIKKDRASAIRQLKQEKENIRTCEEAIRQLEQMIEDNKSKANKLTQRIEKISSEIQNALSS